jgi:hypothetical protein
MPQNRAAMQIYADGEIDAEEAQKVNVMATSIEIDTNG